MRILLVSDTHDNMIAVNKVLEIADREKPDLVIHCGDYVSPFMIKKFANIGSRIVGVWGNNDGDKQTILSIIAGEDFTIAPQPREIAIGGFNALVIHGWQKPDKTRKLVYNIARGSQYKFIFYGHTHSIDISKLLDGEIAHLETTRGEYSLDLNEFKTLIINPGEACGWLTGKGTCIIIDIEEKIHLRILEIFSYE